MLIGQTHCGSAASTELEAWPDGFWMNVISPMKMLRGLGIKVDQKKKDVQIQIPWIV